MHKIKTLDIVVINIYFMYEKKVLRTVIIGVC